jgi:hypothetical protein
MHPRIVQAPLPRLNHIGPPRLSTDGGDLCRIILNYLESALSGSVRFLHPKAQFPSADRRGGQVLNPGDIPIGKTGTSDYCLAR